MTNQLANKIDHTALKPDTTMDQIVTLCEEAKKHGFYSVCVNPTWVKKSAELLTDSDVAVCTVIGFPLGASTTSVKVFETENAIRNGATEVDMVINIGELKAGNVEAVKLDIQAVVNEAKERVLVKVIIETCLLTNNEIEQACKIAVEAGTDYVKTSTGFSTSGATVEDIKLMRKTVGPDIGVKASGGVRDQQTAMSMIEAGATRIGASASVAIVKGTSTTSDY